MSDFYNEEMAAQQERMARTKDMVHQRSELMRVLSPRTGEHILELGSGNGIFARELVDCVGASGRVVGLDSSEAINAMAQHLCPQGEFLLGDAQSLPFEDATFDAVVAAQLFCFLGDVDQALREAFRVLRPGGRIVILDTDWDTLVWRNNKPDLMSRMLVAYRTVYADAHLPKSLGQRLISSGFSNVTTESFVVLNTDFGDDTYAKQTAGFATAIMEGSPDFSAEEQMSWLEDQQLLDQSQGFFFSLNRYVFSGRK
ncbi:methyltransferase domain-containing protein [Shimia aestuarii]|uniref:Ubiquinone/menaquinone biosynthesis C-methylase UbiE n=1 Tax=Shimia aestuarii TaxID=254406 RepID=A0A1I4HQ17_9RHOB|nr:methyltransferase domain-containing protein [Shimia aestuarii]SFL43853.1 Ubiquinone/menaquinone biosynthesis C-methylase UbiE [Shimia aestuarii]